MSVLVRGDVELYYEDSGNGFPVLLLAPGGMESTIERWHAAPIDPLDVLADAYRLVAMDQRNAGRSRGPLDPADPWGSYADDQLAVADELGLDYFHVVGMCIGCAYALKLAERAPARVAAAVLLQPIGIVEESRELFDQMWRTWGASLVERRGDVSEIDVQAFGDAMWGDEGFVGSVAPDSVRGMETPLLVLPGVDAAHPASVGREVAELAPNGELWEPWRSSPARILETIERIRSFLASSTPAAGGVHDGAR